MGLEAGDVVDVMLVEMCNVMMRLLSWVSRLMESGDFWNAALGLIRYDPIYAPPYRLPPNSIWINCMNHWPPSSQIRPVTQNQEQSQVALTMYQRVRCSGAQRQVRGGGGAGNTGIADSILVAILGDRNRGLRRTIQELKGDFETLKEEN
jgi:hypothetical protein